MSGTDDVVRRFDDAVNALERIAVALETLAADVLAALEAVYGTRVYGKPDEGGDR